MEHLDRRSFLRIGIGAPLAATAFSPLAAHGSAKRASAKAVIVLYMEGGPSQLDTFDLKPGQETGGPFRPIDTAARGIRICEHLPQLAREMKHLAVIRSMTSREGDHRRGRYLLHTGHRPEPAVTHPGMGSYVSRELGDPDAPLPNVVAVRARPPGAAFLAATHAPYSIDAPGRPVPNVEYGPGVDDARFSKRMKILNVFEQEFARERATGFVLRRRAMYRKAERFMHAPQLRAFELEDEEERLRTAYGQTPFGQGCLLARRLVERGVKFVEVGMKGWDTHRDNFDRTKRLMETLDPAFSTLVRDLHHRRLLEETLVVWMGEFGRTPRINRNNGRDHWPKSFSVVMAGGGVQGGRAIGETDAQGWEIKKRPVPVEDYAASIYRCLGIDQTRQTVNELGRPIRILNAGAPVSELF